MGDRGDGTKVYDYQHDKIMSMKKEPLDKAARVRPGATAEQPICIGAGAIGTGHNSAKDCEIYFRSMQVFESYLSDAELEALLKEKFLVAHPEFGKAPGVVTCTCDTPGAGTS